MEKKNWLCRLGWHRWTKEKLPYLMRFDQVQLCERCGWARRVDLKGVAYCWLSPREVQRYRELDKLSHAS
jgi:hypothetical protein